MGNAADRELAAEIALAHFHKRTEWATLLARERYPRSSSSMQGDGKR